MKNKKSLKQILAIIVVVLLVAMYVCTLIFSFIKSESAQIMFRASLACTFILPILLYAFMLVAKVLRPTKSPVIDAIIINLSSKELLPGLDELRAGLIRSGYNVLSFGEQGLDFDSLAINSVPARSVYVDDNAENTAKAKKAGFIAITYTDYVEMMNQLSSLGVNIR